MKRGRLKWLAGVDANLVGYTISEDNVGHCKEAMVETCLDRRCVSMAGMLNANSDHGNHDRRKNRNEGCRLTY